MSSFKVPEITKKMSLSTKLVNICKKTAPFGKSKRYVICPTPPKKKNGSAWNVDESSTVLTEDNGPCIKPEDIDIKCNPQFYYTTPPTANMVKGPESDKRVEGGRSLYRISRHLSREKHRTNTSRQRSVSLDWGDARTVKLYNSNEDTMEEMPSLTASPSAPAHLSKSGISPTPGKNRTFAVTPRKNRSSDPEISPHKIDKRRFDKRPSYDNNALFCAVENQDLDLVKEILDANTVDINSVNCENLSPLDIAVMTNNIPMAKMLLYKGAKENTQFEKSGSRLKRLESLVRKAERKVIDLTAIVLNGTSGNSGISPTQQKEKEKELNHWEFRHRLLKRMKAGYDHAKPPDCPTNVTLSVNSSSSLLVRISEPLNHNGAVVTKYKVEWSCYENFKPLVNEGIADNIQALEYEITGLEKGVRYYVKVSAWNMKGYGPSTTSNPLYSVPSCWRDVDRCSARLSGKVRSLQKLFDEVRQSRPEHASTIRDSVCREMESPLLKKRISIKSLFVSAPKFQKSLKRGVYMACVLYNEDKILLTSEDQIPIVEVDENFSGTSIQSDLYWMMKIACTWDDVKSLRQDMVKSSSAGTVHFRSKLLQAASYLQNSLGIQDVGQFFYLPLKDSNGSIVLTIVNHVKDTKLVGLGSSKWVSTDKISRRQSLAGLDNTDALCQLVSSIPEMRLYHQVSTISLPKGLYLGYLKLHSSVENIRVLVPQTSPSSLPHSKIRDCPNVSREEWEWLHQLNSVDDMTNETTTQHYQFQQAITKSCKRLFSSLGIDEDLAASHRLYKYEVIEFSPNVSFILILPSVEDVCIIPGQTDTFTQNNHFTFLPVQVFELIHMMTYQKEFIAHYSRLSSILEMDVNLAQQAQREAFSNEELTVAKDQVEKSSSHQVELESMWKDVRWVKDIISYSRDRHAKSGIPVSLFFDSDNGNCSPDTQHRQTKILDNNNSSTSISVSCNSNEISVGKDNRKIAKFYDPNEESSATSDSVFSDDSSSTMSQSGVLRVYAAYETGFSKTVSVKLHVMTQTTAREVINMVVSQLNKALVSRGKTGPIYEEDQFDDFCLVAVIGVRERVLRDDYQPLQLQNPWTKGRLYVRMRSNVLAAIEQGQATAV
ncbi:hypothetical protein LOTGIDRAFT_235745 [Lottia gigantea]|uniref:Ankyrin repeat and fibronectin type-III domain-containing protein 1 n=1 Tax=Lottia gigantea TaxID=225164 RepID=V4B9V0_LOTGI|nr:hypothetical protein LOTGIDRAFT_235745 [Lottia gigantea]ESO85784.1 hypothetical protein LOTGIDRAFT_235745 [Lottia gigantea]